MACKASFTHVSKEQEFPFAGFCSKALAFLQSQDSPSYIKNTIIHNTWPDGSFISRKINFLTPAQTRCLLGCAQTAENDKEYDKCAKKCLSVLQKIKLSAKDSLTCD